MRESRDTTYDPRHPDSAVREVGRPDTSEAGRSGAPRRPKRAPRPTFSSPDCASRIPRIPRSAKSDGIVAVLAQLHTSFASSSAVMFAPTAYSARMSG